jgi:3-oxoacyl-[acyl-carrier protein] reductase
MPFSLKNHVAVVTGSSTGLGKAIALTLGKAGARVALNYFNNEARGQKALAELTAAGVEAVLVRSDVTTAAGVDLLFSEAEKKLGQPDILVPNATCDQPHKPIEEYDWDFYQSMLDFFIKSPFLMTKRALAGMKQKKWGRIINITSEVFHRSVGNFSGYVAAKGGQIGWSRSMASTPWRPAGSPSSGTRRTRRNSRTLTSAVSPRAAGAGRRRSATRSCTSPVRRRRS